MADVPLLKNPMTTAGDTLYGAALGAPTRVPIGSAGQVWTVNAGATAPEWAAGGGAGAASDDLKQAANGGLLTYTAGRYYGPLGWIDSSSSGTISAADILNFVPFYAASGETFDRICINVTTLQAGGSARLGIFEVAASGLPGALLLDAGTVDCSTTGAKEIVISQALTADTFYWLGEVHNNGSIGMSRITHANTIVKFGLATAAGGPKFHHINQAHAFGALPDPAVPTTFQQIAPFITLRAA